MPGRSYRHASPATPATPPRRPWPPSRAGRAVPGRHRGPVEPSLAAVPGRRPWPPSRAGRAERPPRAGAENPTRRAVRESPPRFSGATSGRIMQRAQPPFPSASARRPRAGRRGRRWRCSPATPSASSCACSTPGARRWMARAARRPAATRPTASGTTSSRTFRVGQHYGLRAHGRWEPARGHRLQPGEAACSTRTPGHTPASLRLRPELFGHTVDDRVRRRPRAAPTGVTPRRSRRTGWSPDGRSTGRTTPALTCPWSDTVIYEAHVRGLTQRLPGVPEQLRGTYAGWPTPPPSSTWSRSGVTTVELLPVHAIGDEPALTRRGRTNYWGYSTLGFFAPHPGYAAAHRPARRRRRVQAHGPHPARGGPRGGARRRLQPHLRGRPGRADAVLARTGRLDVLPARRARPLPRHHRLRQHPRRPPAAGRPADAGLAALLGRRRCTSTGSGSTWRRPWPAAATASTPTTRSWSPSGPTRSSAGSS